MSFESLCLNNLINNPVYSKRVLPYIKEEYFEQPSTKKVFGLIRDFVSQYNALPTIDAVVVMLSELKMAENLFDECIEVASTFDGVKTDVEFMFEKTESWARDRALFDVIQKSIGIYDGTDKKNARHTIPELVTQALSINFDTYLGHDYFDRAEDQFEYYHNHITKMPFGIDIMNRVTRGGVPKKTLNIVQAGINTGKTTWLLDQAVHWLTQGKNVIYFTLEIAEEVVRERMDVAVMGINFDQLHSLEKTQYLNRVSKLRSKTIGNLKIKEFPNGTTHVGHLRHVLNEFKMKQNFVPDVIFVDYMTIMASSRIPAGSNTNTYYKSVAEELRALAQEFDLPLWTAAQFNRAGQTSSNVDISDTGESIGIAATADFMIAFMQPEELAPLNQCIGKVLKNRYANKSKIGKFLIGLDNDLQKYYDIDPGEQTKVMSAEELNLFNKQVGNAPSTTGFGNWKFK